MNKIRQKLQHYEHEISKYTLKNIPKFGLSGRPKLVELDFGFEATSKKSRTPDQYFGVFRHYGFIVWFGVTFHGVSFLDGSEKNL